MGVIQDIDMPRKRVNLSLPEGIYSDLEAWAESQGRPVANLAAYLVEAGVREAKEKGEVPTQNKVSAKSRDK
jgi:hypothetical protein